MAVQDDLATLFAKNLTLSQQPPPPPAAASQDEKIVYISQHYTHTAHISAIPRPTSAPDFADLEHILRSHGVETAALTLPQVELFQRADDSQKARLVQLWTICPPSPTAAANTNHSIAWSATSVEQEEMLARRRYEELQQQHEQQQRQQQEEHQAQRHAPEVVMSLDGTEVLPQLSNSPGSVQSAASGAWEASPVVVHAHTYMEPYMQSGYEELARREYNASDTRKAALDPVYQGGMLDWERQQWMENQYGSFVGGWRDDEEML
ncbi:unnamed protein product [Discula destructiva]